MLQGTDDAVIEAALKDDADVPEFAVERFVEPVRFDERDRRRQPLRNLFLLLHESRGRQHDPVGIPLRILQRLRQREW